MSEDLSTYGVFVAQSAICQPLCGLCVLASQNQLQDTRDPLVTYGYPIDWRDFPVALRRR